MRHFRYQIKHVLIATAFVASFLAGWQGRSMKPTKELLDAREMAASAGRSATIFGTFLTSYQLELELVHNEIKLRDQQAALRDLRKLLREARSTVRARHREGLESTAEANAPVQPENPAAED